ncbi:MAG: hypothetical protein J07HB67_00307 [halophilic archaeon J07HB67]|jgi:hypothetical protein|nr:MAG: hypothetical protein J07HB67_00307 [halophilic archaeon J07HB67]
MVTRKLAVTLGVVLLLLSSGCAATQEEFRFESSPATVSETALSEAGYETAREAESLTVNRTVDAGGQERDVTVVNYASAYTRQVTVAGQNRTLAGAAVFTTPSISVVGQQFNPVADQSNEQLVNRAQNRVEGQIDGGGIDDLRLVENRTATVLDTETTVGVFSGTTTVQGVEVELRILVTKVRHEGDFLIVAGAYPEALAGEERPRLETVFDSVDHE